MTHLSTDHWRLSRGHPGALLKLVLSVVGVTIGCNTDNAAYDLSVHSQTRWAESLSECPEVYYLSIVGALHTTERDTRTGTVGVSEGGGSGGVRELLTALLEGGQRLALRCVLGGLAGCSPHSPLCPSQCPASLSETPSVISHPPLDSDSVSSGCVAGVDVRPWLRSGWDGFVTRASQTRPLLGPPTGDIPATAQAVAGGACGSDTASVGEWIGLEELQGGGVRPGQWYSCCLSIEHMRLVTSCAHTWECVWQGVRLFETDRVTRIRRGGRWGARGRRRAPCPLHPDVRPDMQRYDGYTAIHDNSGGRCPHSGTGALDCVCAVGLVLWTCVRITLKIFTTGAGLRASWPPLLLFPEDHLLRRHTGALCALGTLLLLLLLMGRLVDAYFPPSPLRRAMPSHRTYSSCLWRSRRYWYDLIPLMRILLTVVVLLPSLPTFPSHLMGVQRTTLCVLAASFLPLPVLAPPPEHFSLTLCVAQVVALAGAAVVGSAQCSTLLQWVAAKEAMLALCVWSDRSVSLEWKAPHAHHWCAVWLVHLLLIALYVYASTCAPAATPLLPVSLTALSLVDIVIRTKHLSGTFQKQWLQREANRLHNGHK